MQKRNIKKFKKKKLKQELISNIKKEKQNPLTKENYIKNLEDYLRKYQKFNIQCKDFIKYGKSLYNKNKDNLEDNFNIDDTYLKNTYYQLLKELYNLNLENLYEYAKKLDNGEYF